MQKHSEMGENIIIIGNPEHPEVQGIKGWAGDHVEVFQTKEEAENYSCEQGKRFVSLPRRHLITINLKN